MSHPQRFPRALPREGAPFPVGPVFPTNAFSALKSFCVFLCHQPVNLWSWCLWAPQPTKSSSYLSHKTSGFLSTRNFKEIFRNPKVQYLKHSVGDATPFQSVSHCFGAFGSPLLYKRGHETWNLAQISFHSPSVVQEFSLYWCLEVYLIVH